MCDKRGGVTDGPLNFAYKSVHLYKHFREPLKSRIKQESNTTRTKERVENVLLHPGPKPTVS
jgi:hypothetical protein